MMNHSLDEYLNPYQRKNNRCNNCK